jgi:hypothetical protein
MPRRDTTFSEDTSTSRTGSGPANLATIRAAIIAALKDAGYLHVPEGRRDHTTPGETLHLTASISQEWDIHGTRRSPALDPPGATGPGAEPSAGQADAGVALKRPPPRL